LLRALTLPRPSRSTLFPYTTLFRSVHPPRAYPLSAPITMSLRFTGPAKTGTLGGAHCGRNSGLPHVLPPPTSSRPTTRTVGKDRDRKSTRLNSSHVKISYAVFCLKK